jgi:hypothetical protein
MQSSSPPPPTPSPSPGPPPRPASRFPSDRTGRRNRLGIVHFLVWMLGSALMLAVFRQFDASVDGPLSALRAVVYTFYGLVYGAALAGLLIPFSRYLWGGAAYPAQPGHWLLVANGVIALVFCAVLALESLPASEPFSTALQAGATALPAAAYLWGSFASRDAPRWTVLLGTLAALHGVQALCLGLLAAMLNASTFDLEPVLVALVQTLQSYGTLAAGLLVLVASGFDISQRTCRDWLHWVGVVVELATIAWILFGVFGGLSVFF